MSRAGRAGRLSRFRCQSARRRSTRPATTARGSCASIGSALGDYAKATRKPPSGGARAQDFERGLHRRTRAQRGPLGQPEHPMDTGAGHESERQAPDHPSRARRPKRARCHAPTNYRGQYARAAPHQLPSSKQRAHAVLRRIEPTLGSRPLDRLPEGLHDLAQGGGRVRIQSALMLELLQPSGKPLGQERSTHRRARMGSDSTQRIHSGTGTRVHPMRHDPFPVLPVHRPSPLVRIACYDFRSVIT